MNKKGRISPKVNYHRGNGTWKRLHQESMFEQMCHYTPVIHLQTKPFLHTLKVNCVFWTVVSTIYLNFRLANKCTSARESHLFRNPLLQDSLWDTEFILFEHRILFVAHGFNVVRLNPPNSCLRWCILGFLNFSYFNLKLAGNCVNSNYGSLLIFPVISPLIIPFSLIPERKNKNMFV